MAHTQVMTVKGCTFYYDPADYEDGNYHTAWGAVHYWWKYLNEEEIKTLFHAAKMSGSAVFENNHNNEYKLTYASGRYELSSRHG